MAAAGALGAAFRSCAGLMLLNYLWKGSLLTEFFLSNSDFGDGLVFIELILVGLWSETWAALLKKLLVCIGFLEVAPLAYWKFWSGLVDFGLLPLLLIFLCLWSCCS
jgi:hypothetical protein